MMKSKREQLNIDWLITLAPLAVICALGVLFMARPEQSTGILNQVRGFLGNQIGFYYMLVGFGVFLCSLYIAFSKYGKIRLGNVDKPAYSTFRWGTMIFTSTMAADLLFYSFCEWALYAGEKRIQQLGDLQLWASTYPLFHWGPTPWSFYIVLAVAFGFMMHVRGRSKQKFSEACRPLLGGRIDGIWGKVIDLVAVFSLLAGTSTTFSLATPLLASALAGVSGFAAGVGLTISILLIIAITYTLTVLFGVKGIARLATVCAYLFFLLLFYFLFLGGETVYIVETGLSALGNLMQNYIGLSTWMDPLRASGDGVNGFVQNWTIFYWAYWMVWCIATPFFIGLISKGRTIRTTVLGGYACGLAGTFVSFIVLGNYGLAQQMKYGLDTISFISAGGDISQAIIAIFQTMPAWQFGLVLLVITMIIFYATTFDAITLVVSSYSYKKLDADAEPDKRVRIFWAALFILLPIALIFAESTMKSLQSVSIIAAFPVSIVVLMIIGSFFIDARRYLKGE